MIQKRKRKELYDKFRQGAIPSGADFADFIRSQLNLLDDGVDISDDPDEPVSLRAHSEDESLLDFSDIDGRNRWRISGRSEGASKDDTKEGFNIKADNNSKLFVERETGNIGVNTDVPVAKLHIKQTDSKDAFRIDDDGIDETPFIVTSEGNVGVGIENERPSAKLHIQSSGSEPVLRIDDRQQDETPFIIDGEGKVGIGCDDPQADLTVEGGVCIGDKNVDPGGNNLHVCGNLNVDGTIVLSGGEGIGGLEINGPISSASTELILKDNVAVVAGVGENGQGTSDGNLSIQGDTVLGTYNSDPMNMVTVNGSIRSGGDTDSGEEQYELKINDVLTVNREDGSAVVSVNAPLIVAGSNTLGNNLGDDHIYLNGTVQREGSSDVTIDDSLRVTGHSTFSTSDFSELSVKDISVTEKAEIASLSLQNDVEVNEILNVGNFTENPEKKVTTAKAVKEYVDGAMDGIPSAIASNTEHRDDKENPHNITAAQLGIGAQSPVGSIIIWPTENIPSGYLECNGISLNKSEYPALYSVLECTYGGSGEKFNLPDYRGQFLRGTANGSGNDPDRLKRLSRGDGKSGDVVGTTQGWQNAKHRHGRTFSTDFYTFYGHAYGYSNNGYANKKGNIYNNYDGGKQANPININVIYCIKF
ncbi:MAG: tail fiber protein [Desulfobacterales bacterium]|nr:tail fiber protein [Desulfobacterales bacterium]